jgi:FkbM family methyltransferase
LPIFNPQYYVSQNGTENTLFIIGVPGFPAQRSITKQLLSLGIKESAIFAFSPSDTLIPQYFECFSPKPKETFVDCGSFDGDTSFDFARWCLGNYRKIFTFEADRDNCEKCRSNLSKLNDVTLYNLGVWDKEDVLRFNNTSTGFSSVCLENEVKQKDNILEIRTCALDEVLKNEEITFIKMDIEGAEFKAIQGARRIISEQKPRLAICVYHKPADMWEIPDLLLEYNSEYTFRLRHYGPSAYETVLYAE